MIRKELAWQTVWIYWKVKGIDLSIAECIAEQYWAQREGLA